MKVLTYVNGVLTVIDGDNYFNGEHDKPSFIEGNSFYYEPTLKIMDNVELTEQLINNASEYIENFKFNSDIKFEITEPEFKHYVDTYGNYFYTNTPKENFIEISSGPDENLSLQIWDFNNNNFYSAILIDKIKNTPAGIIKIDDVNVNNFYYGKLSNYNKNICSECQIYNIQTEQFDLDINFIKEKKANKLNEDCLLHIKNQNGDIGNITSAIGNSWFRQELEAKNYLKDPTSPTIYIDQILLGRNKKLEELNKPLETKEILISKILEKSEKYNTLYGNAIGKLTILLKELELSNDYETIENIKW